MGGAERVEIMALKLGGGEDGGYQAVYAHMLERWIFFFVTRHCC